MKIRRYLAPSLACVLGACTFQSAGTGKAAATAPPRLAIGAAERPGITGQLSLCGLTVVGNSDELHFRLELTGERVSVRKGSPNDSYLVDGMKVQVSTLPADRMAPTAAQLTGIELLRTHARFESARLADTLGREAPPEELAVLTSNNMPAGLAWWLPGAPSAAAESAGSESKTTEPPAQGGYPAAPPATISPPAPLATAPSPEAKSSSGIAYMTAAYGHRVLALSVQGSRDEPQSALAAKAQAWMGSLAVSPKAISANRVGQEIAAAKAAGKTCPGRSNAILDP